MKEIIFQPRENKYVKYTFTEDEIRIKAPNGFIEDYRDSLCRYAKFMEKEVDKNFKSSLRGQIKPEHLVDDTKSNFTLYSNTKKAIISFTIENKEISVTRNKVFSQKSDIILEVKNNINYSAQVVEIKNIIPIEKADQIVSTTILGNNVVVSKDTRIGDIGIFFPVEAKLSPEFIRNNNLYRDKTLNADTEKKGFFELNGRIRCIKLRGTKSEGFFMPLSCLSFLDINTEELEIDTMFDTINDIQICEKYIIPARQQSLGGGKKHGKKAKISRIVNNQFRFHPDTLQIGRNMHEFELDEEIDITVKVHGTSAISSYIMCNKKLTWVDKLLLKIGIRLQTTYYDYIYSSRKVIKNDDINKTQHFYSEDVWKKGHDKLQEFLEKGMTIYYEIVGYLSDSSYIQKGYDYGCVPGKFDIYIYRITHTNADGKVYEFTPNQLQMWCKERGLKAVIPVYRGTILDLMDDVHHYIYNEHWRDDFLEILRNEFNGGIEKDCPYCKTKVPFEGYVVRKADTMDFEAYKLKSFLFLKKETEQLDKGEENIEDNQGE